MITSVLLLRLVPYILVLLLAIRAKRWWLAGAAGFLIAAVGAQLALDPSQEVIQILASVFSFLLLMHALQLGEK